MRGTDTMERPIKVFLACFLAFILLILVINIDPTLAEPSQKIRLIEHPASSPIAFIENRGQWPEDVLYRADADGAVMWFNRGMIWYQFSRMVSETEPRLSDPYSDLSRDYKTECIMIKVNLVNSNPNVDAYGEGMLDYKCNFFLGNDKSRWCTNVHSYKTITYKNVYSGIDLKYYGNGQQMEYDFIVSPGTDPSQIRIQYEGPDSLLVNEKGELAIKTTWGTIIERTPVVYQMNEGERILIHTDYILFPNNTFGFKLTENYNPESVLIIDPILVYSTFIGGAGQDWGLSIVADDSGCAYVTGWTGSLDFPVLDNYDSSFNGDKDVYITKLSQAGNSLLYSTYLGGTEEDKAWYIALDDSGCVYLSGYTISSDFPTENAYDSSLNGSYDAFVAKLSGSGDSLIYSTYLGGSNYDLSRRGLAIDDYGCAYVTGYTYSSDFPTENAFDDIHNGNYDAFVTKLSPAGNSLKYSTYLGGTGLDLGWGITVNEDNCCYVVGLTESTNFPVQNAFIGSLKGDRDGFLVKLSPNGDSLLYGTYIGGSYLDECDGVALDDSQYIYLIGVTLSTDFPLKNPIDATHNGSDDVFITKLSPEGDSLIFSTYLGGSSHDQGKFITVDDSGCTNAIIMTFSSDFPVKNAFDSIYAGEDDVVVAKLTPSGTSLIFSTFLGGTTSDDCYSASVSDGNDIYLAGFTFCPEFPMLNAYDSTYNGGDIYVTKFTDCFIDDDDDGIFDYCDNCPNDYNPDQEDTDDDEIGNSCDNCPNDTNSEQQNSDNDSFGDICDNCPNDFNADQSDLDYDAIGDSCDNCIYNYNPDQTDSDGDGIGDSCEYICGDANDDETVNIFDITHIISYLYLGGPPPVPLESADVNIDSTVNIFDVTYIIAFLYLGGEEPCFLGE